MGIKEQLIARSELLIKASKDKELQGLIIASCKKDILYFFENFLYTDKNTNLFTGDEPSVIPFIPFEFQKEYILEVRASIIDGTKPASERTELTNIFVEKSRQMGLSWVTMAIYLYGWIFHDHKYLVISQKDSDVDTSGDMKSLFEKIRFMIDNIPKRMLPAGFDATRSSENNKNKSINSPNGTGSITGESANPNAGRGGTYNSIFLDEMAFMQNASSINTACANATPCRIFNSTPNGQGNEFYRMRELTTDRNINGVFSKAQVKGLRYHWRDHPKYDQEWYDWKIQGMTREKIAQELEIDYNTAIVGRVYSDFPKQSSPVEYDPEKNIYISIDNSHGGTDPNAIIIAQLVDNDIKIIDAIEINSTPEGSARFLSNQPITDLNYQQEGFLSRYSRYNRKRAIFIGDPYDTHVAMGSSTIYKDYKKVGIHLNTPVNNETGKLMSKEDQILITRTNMYRIKYNDNCSDFANAIMNAKYPERKEGSSSTTNITKPMHDWTSHYRTALEYLITYITENPEYKKPKNDMLSDRPMNANPLWRK